jgi:hypothetical protein
MSESGLLGLFFRRDGAAGLHSLFDYSDVNTVAFNMTAPLNLFGAFGYICWAIAYILILRKCFQDRTYGLPLVAICLNFSWEFIASFLLYDPVKLWVYTDRAWLLLDCIVLWQLLKFGRREQRAPEIKNSFFKVVGITLFLAFTGELLFIFTFHDRLGLVTAFIINAIMSILFIFFFFERRDDLRGISRGGAWLKMFGSLTPAIQCAWLIPMFDERIAPVSFLTILSLIIFLADCYYIHLIENRVRVKS